MSLIASSSFDAETTRRLPLLSKRYRWFVEHRPRLAQNLQHLTRQIGGRTLVGVGADRARLGLIDHVLCTTLSISQEHRGLVASLLKTKLNFLVGVG